MMEAEQIPVGFKTAYRLKCLIIDGSQFCNNKVAFQLPLIENPSQISFIRGESIEFEFWLHAVLKPRNANAGVKKAKILPLHLRDVDIVVFVFDAYSDQALNDIPLYLGKLILNNSEKYQDCGKILISIKNSEENPKITVEDFRGLMENQEIEYHEIIVRNSRAIIDIIVEAASRKLQPIQTIKAKSGGYKT